MDSAGDFVVTWLGDGPDGGRIYAQQYNAAGTPQGSQFDVDSSADEPQYLSVAMDSQGDFVVAWEAYELGIGFNVYAQQFNANGATYGSEHLLIYSGLNNNVETPVSVAMDSQGAFVIAYTDRGSNGYDVFAEQFNATGVVQAGELVNTSTSGNQGGVNLGPSVAMDSTGDFVVTWAGYTASNSGGKGGKGGYDIYAQQYNSSGVARGAISRSIPSPPAINTAPRQPWIPRAISSSPGRAITRPVTTRATRSTPSSTTAAAWLKGASSRLIPIWPSMK